MTLAEIILAILGTNAATALITTWAGRRKASADARGAEASADHTIVDSASDVLAMAKAAYEVRIARLEAQVVDLATRLTNSDTRAVGAETRLAGAEARATDFRRAVIAIGERLDKERAKSREMVVGLVGVIEYMLDCVENPSQSKDISRPGITKLIAAILDGYPAEQFVKV
jgi:hypothetical protein